MGKKLNASVLQNVIWNVTMTEIQSNSYTGGGA